MNSDMEEPILNSHNKAEYEPACPTDAQVAELGVFRILSHDFGEGVWRVRLKVIPQ